MESLPAISASDSELQVVFYVSGYCANQVAKRISCGACLSLILSETKLPSTDVLSDFFDIVNRGGLKIPGGDVFILCRTAYEVFCRIKNSSSFNKFMALVCPRNTFVTTVISHVNKNCLVVSMCSASHDLYVHWRHVIATFFNCLVRNYLRSLNPKASTETNDRKIHKLRSTKDK